MLHKKKIKKLLSTVFVFILLSVSIFSFSASALQEVWFSSDTPPVTNNMGYVEVVCSEGSFVFVVFTYEYERPRFSTFTDTNGYLYFKATVDNNGILSEVPCYAYRITQDGHLYTLPQDVSLYSYFRAYNLYLLNGYNVDCSSVTVSVPAEPYTFNYSGDVIISDKLTQIISILQSNSGDANKIVSGINQNADKNASDIQANQDKNTEQIKNGWKQDEDIDTSVTDDYGAKDKELQEATEQGRSEAVSVFNSFGSLFQSDGHLYKGLLSVSAIFTQFMQLDWLSSLLNFSLAIGIFAFVIGTGSSIFKSAHEKFDNRHSKKSNNSDGG